MAEPFIVQSRDTGATLTLRSLDRDYFLAEVRHTGMEAIARVSKYMSDGLGDFFGGLAADWRGWPGTREWSALEGELQLMARTDRTGHTYLRVQLRDGAPAHWTVEAELVLEAGQLERIAAAAQAFEREAISAA